MHRRISDDPGSRRRRCGARAEVTKVPVTHKRQEDRTGGGPMLCHVLPELAGGGAMSERIAAKDWGSSSLGPIAQWPLSLRTALGICLEFPAPACVAWGRQRAQIYNDAYAQLVPIQHETSLGEDFARSWSQAWPAMRMCFERAHRGEAAQLEDQQVTFESARAEQAMTFAFVPIRDDSGSVAGLMVTLLQPRAEQLREELARTKADLDQYGRMISHDFRAPVRTLEQMAKIVATDCAAQLPPRSLNLLNHVVQGAAKLALRADVLSRVESLSHHPLHRQKVDVAALTARTIEELRNAEPDRQIDVVMGELPEVEADFDLLRLVLNSLLSNAFKFTRNVARARIEVNGWREPDRVTYSIKDNGAGFDPKYATRLFGFFQRMHGEDEFEGIGMGLALARRLIERHGGTIWADAEKDRGAEFRFALPA
jgi:signal transduction histidine kinase